MTADPSPGIVSAMWARLPLFALLAIASCDDQAQSPSGKRPMTPREQLLQRIGDINDFDRPRPMVTLEEFFKGNDDPGSIGYNLPDPPMPKDFYDTLKEIRARSDVHDVRIEVQDLEDPEGWPSSDTIWIITTASADPVASWFPKRLQPDEIATQPMPGTTTEPLDVPDGFIAVGAWYD